MNDHPLHDRLTRHLDRVARSTTLRPGSQLGVVRTARRRTARRRQLTAAASVVAVGGVAVVGIQQLADTGPSIQGTEPSDQAAPPAQSDDVETDPTAPPTIGAPAATLGDPQLIWRAVRPDAAGSVSATFGHRDSFSFPGLILSTAPAPTPGQFGGDFVPMLWRSDDGITFSPVESDVPDGFKLFMSRVAGDRIYTFGTAPGIAATDSNPLLASVTRDGGTSWSEIVLPLDTHGLRDVPGLRGSGAEVSGISVQGEAVLVLATGVVQPDFEALGIDDPDATVLSSDAGGVRLLSDAACTPTSMAPDTTAPAGADAAALEQGESEGVLDGVGGCSTTLRPWSDFELSDEARSLLSAQVWTKLLYAPDGQTFTELALPGEGAARHVALPSSAMHVVSLVDEQGFVRLYRTTDGASWQELPPLPRHTTTTHVVEVGGRLVALHNEGAQLLASTLDGDAWTTVDLSAAIGGGYHYLSAFGSGPAGLALAVVEPGPVADSPEATTTSLPAELTVTTDAPVLAGWWKVHVLHTLDGSTWSSEVLDDVIAEPGTVPNVLRIASVGNQLVVNVSLSTPERPDVLPHQVALVGTLRG